MTHQVSTKSIQPTIEFEGVFGRQRPFRAEQLGFSLQWLAWIQSKFSMITAPKTRSQSVLSSSITRLFLMYDPPFVYLCCFLCFSISLSSSAIVLFCRLMICPFSKTWRSSIWHSTSSHRLRYVRVFLCLITNVLMYYWAFVDSGRLIEGIEVMHQFEVALSCTKQAWKLKRNWGAF